MNIEGLTLNQLAERNAVLVSEVEKLRAERDQLAAENVVRQEFVKICLRAAADGASLDGADIQEIGERLGLFGRETYQPVLHGYICGHEAGEDSVYVMKSSPATDRIYAGIKADALPANIAEIIDSGDLESILYASEASYSEEYRMAFYNFRKLREGAK
ncbi:hypothetical protein [Klebsiella michiganensis]|uniref:hypothetical protein n=1 Tax=Klebsiella michiganensis TaxID=1134687 RepID=UPI0012B9A236|nr:hypothetical protein [Klebsiella michiganensis]